MGQLGPDGKETPPPVLPPKTPHSKGDLERRVGALKKLKKRIDAVISDLDTSPAAKHKISCRRVTRRSLGGQDVPFTEADDLFTKYTEVHDTLTLLSTTLRDQIDATGIAIKGADQGFDTLEEDEKRRFWQIQTRVEAAAKKLRHPDGKGGHGEKGQDKGGEAPADDAPKGNADEVEH